MLIDAIVRALLVRADGLLGAGTGGYRGRSRGCFPAWTKIGYLGLGSNVGDRRANLQAAIEDLWAHDVVVLASSSVYETEPVGEVLDQRDFYNACVRIETRARSGGAARRVQGGRARARAAAGGGYAHGPRPIDVDVLLLGGSSTSPSGCGSRIAR